MTNAQFKALLVALRTISDHLEDLVGATRDPKHELVRLSEEELVKWADYVLRLAS